MAPMKSSGKYRGNVAIPIPNVLRESVATIGLATERQAKISHSSTGTMTTA
jgi:hypothetical protein